MRAVIDSDVLIDYLQGREKARDELARYDRREISIISWMEILTGAEGTAEEIDCREFLGTFVVHPVSLEIADEAVRIRRERRIRLPDAIIWATARSEGCIIVTRNSKDFPPSEPGVRMPYRI